MYYYYKNNSGIDKNTRDTSITLAVFSTISSYVSSATSVMHILSDALVHLELDVEVLDGEVECLCLGRRDSV